MPRAGSDALTPRELEVLEAIERRLSNAEIAEHFVISVRTVESHIATLRSKLGAGSRAELMAAARTLRRAIIQLPQNSFVGRDFELEQLARLFESSRWVTVVGPPGTGKTRLALEFASAGARVPLVAELEHAAPNEVARFIAHAAGVGADSSASPLAACALSLGSQPYLMVLDNCDRVSDAAATAIRELLGRAPGLLVLATSRWPLGGSDEAVFTLEPLPTDEDGAVRLFLERAAGAAPGIALTDDERGLVTGICDKLDGLPLAIELAAARVRHLSIRELSDRILEDRDILGGPARGDRHRTLEAAFDWTWDLLEEVEQQTLFRLAALPRTFDLDLAEAVSGRGTDRIVLRLLDRSLVAQTVQRRDPRRFRLLDSVRGCVLRRADAMVVREARWAHARYYADVAGSLAEHIRTDDSHDLIERAREAGPEVAAAIGWALENDIGLAVQLARSLAVCAEHCGPDLDSLAALARAARDPAFRQAARAQDFLLVGIALCYGDLALVDELGGLAISVASDDASMLAAHHLAGFAHAYGGRQGTALEHLAIAEALAENLGDAWQLASVRQGRGLAVRNESAGDRSLAIPAFESAAAAFATAGDAMHVNNCRYMMAASAAAARVRIDEAIGWAEECEVYARRTGNLHELAHARLTRATLVDNTDVEALAETADTFRRVGDLRCLARTYFLRARLEPEMRVAHLEAALQVATIANDHANRLMALEQLTSAHWEAGNAVEAGKAFGGLVVLAGREGAEERCPPEMRPLLDSLRPHIAEGEAHVRGGERK